MIATEAMQALQAGQIPAMSADAVIKLLATRCDELLDQMAEKNRTISLQAALIESMEKHPLPGIQPGDLDRIDTILLVLRPEPMWRSCVESLERVLANVREV
jgi:predicted esterase YcpF (UPF0227 family)